MAVAVLRLLTFKDGRVRRLELECQREDNAKASRVLGASPVKGNKFTYPPDEVCVLVLKHLFGDDLHIEPDVTCWFDEKQAHAKKVFAITEQEDTNVDVPYQAELKPYQRVAVAFAHGVKRGIIADDRGLGKTLEALTACYHLKKVLVVAPGYLKYGWGREIEKWLDGRTYTIVEGERKERESLLQIAFKGTQFTVVNYEMLREKVSTGGYPEILNQRWDAVIFDEAHRLKSKDSQWTKGAKKLQTEYLFELTGNPIANSPDEIWQLLNLIDPNRFTSYWAFVEYFCNVVQGFYGPEVVGINSAHLAQLQFILQPLMIRRLKADVAPWLPDKIHHTVEVNLTGKQKTFYKRAEKQMVLELANGGIDIIDNVASVNIRLQQALANPSILGGVNESVVEETVLDMLTDVLHEGPRKAIVGMWYRLAVASMSERLTKKGIVHFIITGDVAGPKRDNIVETFKACTEPCVLLGTIKAMSEGINVDECDNIIYADKGWSPLDNEQFEDRIHRLTSTRVKNYWHIVVRDSISADREEVLTQKTKMIDEVLCMREVAKKMIERVQK